MSAARTPTRPWVIGLGLVALGLVVFLLTAETPSDAARDTAERLEAGKRPRPEADFITGLWWAACVNLGLVIALLATVKLWVRRLGDLSLEKGFAPVQPGRRFLLALLAIVVLAGAMRWNLAHSGFWWDELWPVKYGIAGYHLNEVTDPLEERYFADASWQRALWHYTRPTNHPAASFPGRVSHVIWRSVTQPDLPHAFSEFAIRFPNWLAAIGAVGSIGLIGAIWGRPVAGLLAALVLALHPWHIRYGIDLRGYSWVVLWTAMGLIWLTAMFRAGRSRWWPWLGFGVNQALLVWAFPHAVFVAGAFFVMAGFLVFRTWSTASDRASGLLRLLVVNFVGGMLFLQIFAPNLIQIPRWYQNVAETHTEHGLDAGLMRDFLSDWFTGMPWALPDGVESMGLASLTDRADGFLLLAMLSLIAVVLIIGAGRLWREQRTAALVLAVTMIAGGGLLAFFGVTQSFFYSRFLVFLVVPFALLIGVAGDWETGKKRLAVLLAAGALGVFSWLVTPQWHVLMSRPFSPMGDVAKALSKIKRDTDQPIVYVCYGHGLEMFPIYWPEMRDAVSLADLENLATEAKSKNGRLLVAYGHPGYNRAELPEGFTWLDDPKSFELLGSWPGIEPDRFFRLLEWTGKASE